MWKKITIWMLVLAMLAALVGCGSTETAADTESAGSANSAQQQAANQGSQEDGWSDMDDSQNSSSVNHNANNGSGSGSAVNTGASSESALDVSELFSNRDLRQEADLSESVSYTMESGKTITITSEGVYVLSGTAADATVVVEAGDEDKVQLVLNGLSVTNSDFPCVYVKNADKVFVTTAEGTENSLSVTGDFTADGDTNTDAVIFSKDDLVLNGLGSLPISSSDNGISCKDDLKITGGSLNISAVADALEAHDSISMADGSVTINTKKDGLHAEYDEDDSVGYVYIGGGSLTVQAGDDAIHATTILQIDDGNLNLSGGECLEATWVQVNGGSITINASDDGINGARKSSAYSPTVEINGGEISITMGAGDTDGIDSNGSLYINGGTLSINAQSPFDYDGQGVLNGGTVTVNGTQVTSLTNQFGGGMGGMGGHGGFGGQGGFPGGQGSSGEMGTIPGDNSGDASGQQGQFPGGQGGFPGGQQGGQQGGGRGGRP